jgi:protein-disulfide isomerase
LRRWAEQAGVEGAAFQQDFEAHTYASKVDSDIALGRRLGIKGTPVSYINGQQLRGAKAENEFVAVIDAQLNEARQEIASGTPRDRVYVTLCNRNLQPSEGAKGTGRGEAADTTTVWKVPVAADDPVRGPRHAPVTIVEFGNFQCVFCRKAAKTLEQIRAQYPEDVRLVWKDHPLPMHEQAEAAALLAREAQAQQGDQGFWKAHDLLFERGFSDEPDLLAHATRLGLGAGRVREALSQRKHRAVIEAGADLAAGLEAKGTPTFFINGRRLKGAQPLEKFRNLIEEEIPKAKQLLATGVPAADLYARLVQDGQGPKEPEIVQLGAPPANSPWRGAPQAKVVIQEFSDFQCPFCKRVQPALAQVLEEYGAQVKLVWRHKPLGFHQQAALASEAAQEAKAQRGNQAFWAFHDKLFENQKDDGLKRPALERYARELGLDMARFNRALDQRTHKAFVDADVRAAEDAGLRGTPQFVINGYLLKGAQPYGAFRRIIRRALQDAARK